MTLRPRQNGRHFADIFKCISLNENVWISIKISLNFVPESSVNNSVHKSHRPIRHCRWFCKMSDDLFKIIRHIVWSSQNFAMNNWIDMSDDFFKMSEDLLQIIRHVVWWSKKNSSWSLVNNIPALVQIMTWRWPGNKPLSEQMMVNLLTYIFMSLGFNELIALAWMCNYTPRLWDV